MTLKFGADESASQVLQETVNKFVRFTLSFGVQTLAGFNIIACVLQRSQEASLSQPLGARQLVTDLQSRLQAVMPRFRELMDKPGAAEIRAELTREVIERSVARAIRLVFNPSQPQSQAQQLGSANVGNVTASGAGVTRVGSRPGVLTAKTAPPVQQQRQWSNVQQTSTAA